MFYEKILCLYFWIFFESEPVNITGNKINEDMNGIKFFMLSKTLVSTRGSD